MRVTQLESTARGTHQSCPDAAYEFAAGVFGSRGEDRAEQTEHSTGRTVRDDVASVRGRSVLGSIPIQRRRRRRVHLVPNPPLVMSIGCRWMRSRERAGQAGLSTSGARTTFRSATSCCAVIAIFADRSTRGVHPRFNCAARKPDNTANSNALIPVGRLIMAASVASATLTRSKALMRALAGMAEDSEKQEFSIRPLCDMV